nr:hypothetical protein [Arthrobacter crusticola]
MLFRLQGTHGVVTIESNPLGDLPKLFKIGGVAAVSEVCGEDCFLRFQLLSVCLAVVDELVDA